MYYDNTNKHPLGANDFNPYKFNYIYPNYSWVKYVVTAVVAIGLRFLCCG